MSNSQQQISRAARRQSREKIFAVCLALAAVIGGTIAAQAVLVTYTETFQYPALTTLASNSGDTFAGSQSPHPTWTYSESPANASNARVDTVGTLTLATPDNVGVNYLKAEVMADQLLGAGHTTFDVSQLPLTVSANMGGNGWGYQTSYGNPGGYLLLSLTMGDLLVGYIPGLSDWNVIGDNSLYQLGSLGFTPVLDTQYAVSATLSDMDSSHYTLDFSVGAFSDSITVAKTDVGDLTQVGLEFKDGYGGHGYFSDFSTTYDVPEPSIALLLLTGLALVSRRVWPKG